MPDEEISEEEHAKWSKWLETPPGPDEEISEEEHARFLKWMESPGSQLARMRAYASSSERVLSEEEEAVMQAWMESPEGKIDMLRSAADMGEKQAERIEAGKEFYTGKRQYRQACLKELWEGMVRAEKNAADSCRCFADLMEAVEEIKGELAKLKESK